MGTIIWKNVIMLIAVTVFGIILILLGIRKKKFCGILFPGIIASNVLCVICIC